MSCGIILRSSCIILPFPFRPSGRPSIPRVGLNRLPRRHPSGRESLSWQPSRMKQVNNMLSRDAEHDGRFRRVDHVVELNLVGIVRCLTARGQLHLRQTGRCPYPRLWFSVLHQQNASHMATTAPIHRSIRSRTVRCAPSAACRRSRPSTDRTRARPSTSATS